MVDHSNLTKIKLPETYEVGLASEENRYKSVFKSLDLITKDLNDTILQLNPANDYILIKPSCVVATSKNCATNVEALRATLDFLKGIWSGKVILGEGSSENTFRAFLNYGYENLRNEYQNLEFLDLNYSDSIFVDIFDSNMRPRQVSISNTLSCAPLRISISPPKIHNEVIVTLSIKNMAVGSILGNEKSSIHQGTKAINHSIAKLFEYTYPHVSIIDGWQGMEGDGPVGGKMIDTKFCLASMNALAADCFCTKMMGFNPIQVGYLNLLGAEDIIPKILVTGKNPDNFLFKFKPHKTYLEQINWT